MMGKAEYTGKVAVISRDYHKKNQYGLDDFSPYFRSLNELCDENGADTILYAPYTWDRNSPVPRNHKDIFEGLKKVRTVILEIGTFYDKAAHTHEIWQRDSAAPQVVQQHFAKSTSLPAKKQKFISEVGTRIFGDAFLMICGESNIVGTVRGDESIRDKFGFNEILKANGIRVVLNPIHDYMRRYEMKLKRRYYSLDGRATISVWNQGKLKNGKRIGESSLPWTYYVDGQDCTSRVQFIKSPFSDRPDIKIGITG